MMKGLMGRCLKHETTIGRIRGKAKVMEDELIDLKAWRATQEKKLKMVEEARDEAVQQVEGLKRELVAKDEEARQARVEAVREYRDSANLIAELSVVYNDGFDDALRQVRKLYPDLDLSSVSVSAPEPSNVQPVQFEDTDALFENALVHETTTDHVAVDSQAKVVEDPQAGEGDGADQK